MVPILHFKKRFLSAGLFKLKLIQFGNFGSLDLKWESLQKKVKIMIKKIQEKTDLFIEFTPEEIESFGWEENQKLS